VCRGHWCEVKRGAVPAARCSSVRHQLQVPGVDEARVLPKPDREAPHPDKGRHSTGGERTPPGGCLPASPRTGTKPGRACAKSLSGCWLLGVAATAGEDASRPRGGVLQHPEVQRTGTRPCPLGAHEPGAGAGPWCVAEKHPLPGAAATEGQGPWSWPTRASASRPWLITAFLLRVGTSPSYWAVA
jgi:hypothetical protein